MAARKSGWNTNTECLLWTDKYLGRVSNNIYRCCLNSSLQNCPLLLQTIEIVSRILGRLSVNSTYIFETFATDGIYYYIKSHFVRNQFRLVTTRIIRRHWQSFFNTTWIYAQTRIRSGVERPSSFQSCGSAARSLRLP